MTFFSPCGAIRTFAAAHGVAVDGGFFAPDDAAALLPGEQALMARRSLAQRQASGAARRIARGLLAQIGRPAAEILVDADGAPLWPAGFCGALAHDGDSAVAAIRAGEYGVGVDVEPNEPLPEDAIALVATPTERARLDPGFLRSRGLFVVKEACFKALFPRDRKFLEFCDIEVDLAAGRALARPGGACVFALDSGVKIMALAIAAPDQP